MGRILLSLISLAFVSACSSNRRIYPSSAVSGEKASYRIEVIIEGEKDNDILFGKYIGTDVYPTDTIMIDKNGKTVFTGCKPLVSGMYAVMTNEEPVFDFLISDSVNQKFTISATKGKYLETLSFKDSPENSAFADYSRAVFLIQKKANSLSNAEIESLTEQINIKETEIKAKFPGSLLESVAMAMNPAYPKHSEIPKTSAADRQNYLSDFHKQRYWDRFPLTDSRMINTPILISSVNNYFNNMVSPVSDSIIRAVDILLAKAGNDTAMMKFLTGYIFNKYLNLTGYNDDSPIIGADNVVIHIIDNYYLAGKANVTDEKFIGEIIDYANKTKETLTGKQAKELKMETVTGGAESLYDIDSPYVLVCFFDVSCSHCQYEIPEIYKIFKKFKNRGLAGFCVYTRDDKKEWVEFVSKHKLTDWINVWDPTNKNDYRIAYSLYSVPQVYVLDKDKKIVGRGLESASLAKLLNHLIKNKDNQ